MADKEKKAAPTTENEQDYGDLPQGITESYGTGVKEEPAMNGARRMRKEMAQYNSLGPELTGGDIDAAWDQANVGDEAVGGTVATPDQNVVEELAAAVGLEIDDRTDLRTIDMLDERDDNRWELDPMASEDYEERRD
ncbi:DUF6335 family protein [Ancylothrix sp. C2]|uniref:DUF6335 family protein n=1 Tax=Ancylothrix sp. D3o TaxID=2953691 RepID=UPI0021BAB9E1|nr:DUF6335 family protein [Ancylothrix sp. D3o]MCT7952190.1 DUF6335 family protein [Ancylothrix sp. D3o]